MLRAKHDIYVVKDGTTRHDSVDAPLTHFKPSEVGISIEKLRELGYDRDINIKPLEDEKSHQGDDSGEPFIITTSGPDKKGLVAMISRIIADSNANITNLTAVFKGGRNPDSNIMIYEIDVPAHTNMNVLSRNLREKALENELDLTIQHKNILDAVNRI